MLRANVSQFKAKLGKFMRAVKEGGEVIVTDRDHPVARLVPIAPKQRSSLSITEPDPSSPALGTMTVKGISYHGTNSTAVLMEERNRR